MAVPKLQRCDGPKSLNSGGPGGPDLGVPNPVIQNGDTPVVPELPVTNSEIISVSFAISQRVIFAFYVMAVQRAEVIHTSMLAASDSEPVYHPEPTSCLKTSPEFPVFPDLATEAVAEQSPLPDMTREAALFSYVFALLCVWATHTFPFWLPRLMLSSLQSQTWPRKPPQSHLPSWSQRPP